MFSLWRQKGEMSQVIFISHLVPTSQPHPDSLDQAQLPGEGLTCHMAEFHYYLQLVFIFQNKPLEKARLSWRNDSLLEFQAPWFLEQEHACYYMGGGGGEEYFMVPLDSHSSGSNFFCLSTRQTPLCLSVDCRHAVIHVYLQRNSLNALGAPALWILQFPQAAWNNKV